MPRNSGGIRSLAWKAGRPYCVPAEVQGRRRADQRCRDCQHMTVYRGPTPASEWFGGNGESWVCGVYGKELAFPTAKRPCPRFEPRG